MDEATNEVPLSVGTVIGGTSPSSRRWQDRIRNLSRRVCEARSGVESPINVNVVFHVPGHILGVDFQGVRTGRFSKKDSWLMVQVALPEEPPEDVDAYLKLTLVEAIDEAERWSRKRKLADDLQSLHRLVEAL